MNFGRGFRITRHEITYDQFDYYVWREQGSSKPPLEFPTTAKGGRGNRPVVNVDWHEADAYARWLGRRIGQDCRLPTEAEWEYAARGGKATAYPWGDEPGTNKANCRNCGSQWDNEQSAPVGRFEPNGFGLFDTSGNVWEWTCSAFAKRFDGREQKCAKSEDSSARVVRGGSWDVDAFYARSAARLVNDPVDRVVNIGFRVLCSSPIE